MRLAHSIGIALAAFRKLDDPLGNFFSDRIGSVYPKGHAGHFECDAHDALGFCIEGEAVQVRGDGHGTLLITELPMIGASLGTNQHGGLSDSEQSDVKVRARDISDTAARLPLRRKALEDQRRRGVQDAEASGNANRHKFLSF
jgi:hypothetical protein